jgi:hypothetical protein
MADLPEPREAVFRDIANSQYVTVGNHNVIQHIHVQISAQVPIPERLRMMLDGYIATIDVVLGRS